MAFVLFAICLSIVMSVHLSVYQSVHLSLYPAALLCNLLPVQLSRHRFLDLILR